MNSSCYPLLQLIKKTKKQRNAKRRREIHYYPNGLYTKEKIKQKKDNKKPGPGALQNIGRPRERQWTYSSRNLQGPPPPFFLVKQKPYNTMHEKQRKRKK